MIVLDFGERVFIHPEKSSGSIFVDFPSSVNCLNIFPFTCFTAGVCAIHGISVRIKDQKGALVNYVVLNEAIMAFRFS